MSGTRVPCSGCTSVTAGSPSGSARTDTASRIASHQPLCFDLVTTLGRYPHQDQQHLERAPQLVQRWELFQGYLECWFLQAHRGAAMQFQISFQRRPIRRPHKPHHRDLRRQMREQTHLLEKGGLPQSHLHLPQKPLRLSIVGRFFSERCRLHCLISLVAYLTQLSRLFGQVVSADQEGRLAHPERWLVRESHVLANKTFWPKLWPERLPGLFYQQLAKRATEEGQPMLEGEVSIPWVRQLAPVRAENQALLRVFADFEGPITSVAFSPDGRQVLIGGFIHDDLDIPTSLEPVLNFRDHEPTPA